MSSKTMRKIVFDAAKLPSLGLVALLGMGVAAAQYPGRTQKQAQNKPPAPRAVAVLEWVGDPGKPVASRIVPVTVFVNGGYQDGGLYLAQPEPLTVETDTLYQLERAGVPKGNFEVAGGQNVDGAWFGFGRWRPLDAPKPVKKLTPSKTLPKVVQDNDPDRPHFKGGDPAPGASQPTPPKPAPEDPDKPTLHRRADSGNSGGSQAPTNPPAPDDPDRPHLKKRSDTAAATGAAAVDGSSPVSSVNEADPDRPKLSRDKPAAAGTALEATKLSGMPPELQQMAAVSDPAVREQHSFAYPWPAPEDAARMQTAVEALAIKTLLASGAAPAAPATPRPIRPSSAPSGLPTARSGAHRAITMRGSRANVPAVTLSEKDFRAYELSYNGGATVVFTAKAAIATNDPATPVEKYITIIAQPDFNGDPQVRLQSVTDAKHLDITPRMRLVDAVDTDGDNRAELVFELRHASDRQFAIYKVVANRAEQAFATETLPYGTPSHTEIKAN